MKDYRWYSKNIDSVYSELNTNINGLSQKEAELRIQKYGKNELPKKKKDSIFKIILGEFMDPIVILMLVAMVASLVVGEVVDAIAILFIVMVDIIMGAYQENKANNTADALSNLVRVKSRVLRDGKQISIDSSDVTIGDIVLLESGDKISADLRVIESHNFMIDEAILTGESVQVNKTPDTLETKELSLSEQTNMLFSGTTVVTGRAKAVVTSIGLDTEIGKIANTINNTKEEKSPLTIRVEKFSKQITVLILIIAAIVTALLIYKNTPFTEIFLSVIALSVSAMPEGLPLALTMALTIASNKMAKRNVIAKKLHSVESLGSCTVIASDKTGTLTVNEQTAKKILLPNGIEYSITGTGYEIEGEVSGNDGDISYAKQIAWLGALNNEAQIDDESNKRIGDSIDIAFLVLGRKLNVDLSSVNKVEEIPYESENKYSAVFYEKDGETYCTVKGSLETVAGFCKNINLVDGNIDMELLNHQNESLARDGYRVIAVANGKVNSSSTLDENSIKDLSFMGMVGFIDPIRKEVVASIEQCRTAGIKVLMITGDHPLTAFSIAKELNLTNKFEEVTTGNEVSEILKQGKDAFDSFVKSKKVFTRVTPLQKLEIVESLKRQGEFVAVTGDGVNDAPALRTANIGIAMGSGTDIARETAKMIIVDDNFKSIVAGIEEGRVAYANIRKIILFLISCGIAEVLFFCLSIFFNLPMPLVAIQLLWLNLVTDGVQDMALSFEKAEKDVMKQKPRNTKEALFDKSLIEQIAVSAITIGVLVFGVWAYLIKKLQLPEEAARGIIMALMVFIQNVHVFNCRSEKKSIFKTKLFSNWFIPAGVAFSILLQVIIMEVPILSKFLKTTSVSVPNMLLLFALSLVIIVVMEIYKALRYSKKERE